MTGYWQASLKDMIDVRGEAVMQNELSRFSCPLNPDIEYFIKAKAIEFEKWDLLQRIWFILAIGALPYW